MAVVWDVTNLSPSSITLLDVTFPVSASLPGTTSAISLFYLLEPTGTLASALPSSATSATWASARSASASVPAVGNATFPLSNATLPANGAARFYAYVHGGARLQRYMGVDAALFPIGAPFATDGSIAVTTGVGFAGSGAAGLPPPFEGTPATAADIDFGSVPVVFVRYVAAECPTTLQLAQASMTSPPPVQPLPPGPASPQLRPSPSPSPSHLPQPAPCPTGIRIATAAIPSAPGCSTATPGPTPCGASETALVWEVRNLSPWALILHELSLVATAPQAAGPAADTLSLFWLPPSSPAAAAPFAATLPSAATRGAWLAGGAANASVAAVGYANFFLGNVSVPSGGGAVRFFAFAFGGARIMRYSGSNTTLFSVGSQFFTDGSLAVMTGVGFRSAAPFFPSPFDGMPDTETAPAFGRAPATSIAYTHVCA